MGRKKRKIVRQNGEISEEDDGRKGDGVEEVDIILIILV